ncbi:ATP-binding cassette, subfamily C, CydD [Virgibacillus chiguensis]|uniref:ATP-binding cassette, subfamily C, CydD n=2 Tax=Virgibacillus chiguensis TaxID=411959 RepID=A0A1M5TM30_9BACI|nr:ATP-binding cassette, subfamily C, CydD [Virgibacillus chiguensis]
MKKMMRNHLLTYKGVKPTLAIVISITIVEAIAIILQAKWLAEWLFRLFNGELFQETWKLGVFFLIAFVTRYLMGTLKKKITFQFAEKTRVEKRKLLLAKLFALGPSYTSKHGTAKLVNLAMEGANQQRTYLELIIPKMIAACIIPPMVLIYVFFQDKLSSIILFLTVPIIIAFMILLGLAANKKMERQWHSYHLLSNHFIDSLRGLETLKFLGKSKSHGDTIEKVSDEYRKSTISTLRIAFLSSFALDFFTMLSVASVAVGLGLRLIEGNLLLDIALVVLILAPEFFLPIKEVGADYHATLNGQEAAKAIDRILAEPVPENHSVITNSIAWTANSTLKLSSISHSHDDNGLQALSTISMQVKGFENIGIVGASGAGKSTLIDILGGFLTPNQGRFRVNQQILDSLNTEAWQRQITYIPQRPYIFSQSVADNIRFYEPNASDEDVWQAVQDAELDKLIHTFPNGIEQEIGTGARAISGGQEQRVALARAFLGNRPILLLDEPTAHLDIETEYELKQTMTTLFKDKLVFFATHRLHWMEQMDKIIVLKDGVIVEVGTPHELLLRRGEYYDLVLSQLEGVQ